MPDPLPIRWQPASAWTPIATSGCGGAGRGSPGVRIEPMETAHVLSVVARSGRQEDLASLVAETLDAALPSPGRLAEGRDGCLVVWSGPDHWLVITPAALPAQRRHDLQAVATSTDQSSARALLELSGPDVRDALAKGFAIDLHPSVFQPGCTAVTSVAHISVQIWQREESRYTIAVPRSFASSFWTWLIAASAVYGYEVAA